jgi:general secretion pathway protein M
MAGNLANSAVPNSVVANSVGNRAKAQWARLAPREQRGLVLAALVCGAWLLWGVLLAPPLRTLASMPKQRAALDAELASMQALQQRAQALQQRSAVSPQEATAALQKSVALLGEGAKLGVVAPQATLTLQKVPAQALAQWLAQPAALKPVEVHLQRSTASAVPAWDGTLVFRLPAGAQP